MRHSLLGEKVEYDELNAKQQEAYNLQKVSSIFAEYGWLVIKLSDDWNGTDFIALEFGTDRYLRVQLKGRFGFWKKYIGQNINICFCDRGSGNWYLYPHDELCEVIIERYKNTDSWKDKGIFHWPSLPPEHRNQLEQYIMNKNDAERINAKDECTVPQSTDNKKLGKDHSIDIINQELSLNIHNGNSAYSSINANVNQWSFNIPNSRFRDDLYIILEDQEDKVLYCFFLERGTITDPTIVFNQRNDERVTDKSIIMIPKNDRNFTNYWQGIEFQFINYRILEMNYE